MDPILCNAVVDFDIPGKPNPPPVKLTATVWTQSQYLPTGTLEKYAIEWTDPSGKLASPSTPLNTWVQKQNRVVNSDPAQESCLEDSPVIFRDQHDDDSKVVTLSGNQLSITPFGNNARLSTSLQFPILGPCFLPVLFAFAPVFCLNFEHTNILTSKEGRIRFRGLLCSKDQN